LNVGLHFVDDLVVGVARSGWRCARVAFPSEIIASDAWMIGAPAAVSCSVVVTWRLELRNWLGRGR